MTTTTTTITTMSMNMNMNMDMDKPTGSKRRTMTQPMQPRQSARSMTFCSLVVAVMIMQLGGPLCVRAFSVPAGLGASHATSANQSPFALFATSKSSSPQDFFAHRKQFRNATSSLHVTSSTSGSVIGQDLMDMDPARASINGNSNNNANNANGDYVFNPSSDDPILSNQQQQQPNAIGAFLEDLLSGFWGPRLVLAAIACFYATNFPLGTIMAETMPSPAAATSARMVLAALALSPFLSKLDPSLRRMSVFAGLCTSAGYITQSMALVDTSPATVSFLGSATVLVCPFLAWAIDGKPMSWKEAPQTWMAAILCMMGVACLELFGNTGGGVTSMAFNGGMGDALALLQAVSFGTQVYLSERMVAEKPDQALPVTATLIATAAAVSSIWCVADGWMWGMADWQSYTLPGIFFEPSLRTAACAIAWTGFVSTALSFLIEMNALSRVPSAQASVILATEPMWAALFAAGLLGESFGSNDVVGGVLMVTACVVSGLKSADIHKVLSFNDAAATAADGDDEHPGDLSQEVQMDMGHPFTMDSATSSEGSVAKELPIDARATTSSNRRR